MLRGLASATCESGEAKTKSGHGSRLGYALNRHLRLSMIADALVESHSRVAWQGLIDGLVVDRGMVQCRGACIADLEIGTAGIKVRPVVINRRPDGELKAGLLAGRVCAGEVRPQDSSGS